MPGDTCLVCKNSHANDPNISFYHFPANPVVQGWWLRVFQLEERQAKSYSKVYSRHFLVGSANTPTISHHFSSGTVWLSEGALNTVPGISLSSNCILTNAILRLLLDSPVTAIVRLSAWVQKNASFFLGLRKIDFDFLQCTSDVLFLCCRVILCTYGKF